MRNPATPSSRFHFALPALAVACLTTALYALAPASDADKAFVAKVSQGGTYEVEASKYAVTKATAPDVKDLAIAEVHDHEIVGGNLKAICARTGIPVPPALNAEFSARLKRLEGVATADFDAAYIADMESIHDKDQALFAQEANEGSDNFKTFAQQTDLIVKRHIGALHGLDH